MREELPRLVTRIGEAHGCTVDAEFIESYPVTVNDVDETAWVFGVLDERFGADQVVRLPAPSMASEDFAYVLEEVPGTLVSLGVRPDDVVDGEAARMHSEGAVFDDGRLGAQAELLADLAWRRLTR